MNNISQLSAQYIYNIFNAALKFLYGLTTCHHPRCTVLNCIHGCNPWLIDCVMTRILHWGIQCSSCMVSHKISVQGTGTLSTCQQTLSLVHEGEWESEWGRQMVEVGVKRIGVPPLVGIKMLDKRVSQTAVNCTLMSICAYEELMLIVSFSFFLQILQK